MTTDRPHLLLVDDDVGTIRLLTEVLKDRYEIHFATDAANARLVAQKVLPDVVLLDAEMPGMDGYELCHVLKSDPVTAGIAIIFVTSHSGASHETRALESGAVDFIAKPVSPPVVRARVHTHVTLKRQTDMLRHLSLIDGLTGVANRRRFDETLDRETRRAVRTGTPLGVVLIDVDVFKAFNDHYGHLEGDRCLRAVAGALDRVFARGGDILARYGGEEFAAVLADTDRAGTLTLAHRAREAVAALGIPHGVSPVADHVTVSLGVAAGHPADHDGSDLSWLLRAADAALYQAKKDGRDRVCVQSPEN